MPSTFGRVMRRSGSSSENRRSKWWSAGRSGISTGWSPMRTARGVLPALGGDCGPHQVGGGLVVEALAAEATPGPEVDRQPDQRRHSLRFAAACGEAAGQGVCKPRRHAIEVLPQELVELRDRGAVAEEPAEHRLDLAVPAVEPS